MGRCGHRAHCARVQCVSRGKGGAGGGAGEREKVSRQSIGTITGGGDTSTGAKRTSARIPVDYKRQREIYDPQEKPASVTIIGAGNIGSHSALALARMGIARITVYDDDIVEVHNLSSQAYRVGDVHKKKVDALAEMIAEIAPQCTVIAVPEKYNGAPTDTIVISAVDSLDTRREIADMLKTRSVYVIDGRMGGGQVEVYAQRAHSWRKTIPAVGDDDPCGARYISYTSYMIAGVIANTVKRHIMGEIDIARLLLHTNTYQIITERHAKTGNTKGAVTMATRGGV